MNKIISFISSIGIKEGEKEDIVLQKKFLLYQAILMSIGGIIWGILALMFNRSWQSIVPFGYAFLTALNLMFFHVTGNFKVVKTIQTFLSLLLPFLFQWFLGGFVASGAVMLWALLSLATSVTYQKNRTIGIWLGMFILLVLISGIFDKQFYDWVDPQDAQPYAVLFFLLNISVISTIIIWLFNFMVRGKNDALKKLQDAQTQLIHSEKMASLGELTAGIAHEIQNPLNFVNNFSEVNKELIDELKSELATGNLQSANEIADDIKDNSEKINHHGKRADAIVKGMLQHSHSGTGIKEPTDINSLADEYLRLAYHGLQAKDKLFKATTKTDFDKSIGSIRIIPQDIGKVILNLINNAFYACTERSRSAVSQKSAGLAETPPEYEPTVFVITKKNNGTIEISVKDNGNGIPQKVLGKIFQPFFTTKPTGQGTGLGLSLSYDIIKAHGGEIKVESKEGEGTEFIIQLPGN